MFYEGSTQQSCDLQIRGHRIPDRMEIEVLFFAEGRKTGEPGEKLKDENRQPNSIHIWRRVHKSNPGHTGGSRVISYNKLYQTNPVYRLDDPNSKGNVLLCSDVRQDFSLSPLHKLKTLTFYSSWIALD